MSTISLFMLFQRLETMNPSASRHPSAACALRAASSSVGSNAPEKVLSRWVWILYSNMGISFVELCEGAGSRDVPLKAQDRRTGCRRRTTHLDQPGPGRA